MEITCLTSKSNQYSDLNDGLGKISSTRAAINIGLRGKYFRFFGGYVFSHKYSYEKEDNYKLLNTLEQVFDDYKGYNWGISIFISKLVLNVEGSMSQTSGSWEVMMTKPHAIVVVLQEFQLDILFLISWENSEAEKS